MGVVLRHQATLVFLQVLTNLEREIGHPCAASRHGS